MVMNARPLRLVVLGESGVGKTSFADRVAHDTQYHRYDPFALPHDSQPPQPGTSFVTPVSPILSLQGPPNQAFQTAPHSTHMKMLVDGDLFDLFIIDISLTSIRVREPGFVAAVFDSLLKEAHGVVLLYDITSEESYTHVTEFGWDYIWACKPAVVQRYQRFGCTLVGNKVDLVRGDNSKMRQVPKGLAEEWASMVGVNAFEVDRFDKAVLEDVLRDLVRSTNRANRRDEEDFEVFKERKKAARAVEEQAAQPAENPKQKNKKVSTLSRLKGILPSRLSRGSGSNSKA